MKTKIFQLAVVLVGGLLSIIGAFGDPLNNWHWRNPLPNGNPTVGPYELYSMIFTNGQFFAVGDQGYEGISSDGEYWTESPTATTNPLNSIVYGGGQFVVVGNNGTVETSPDGVNWTLQSSGITNSLSGIAYGNGTYCAVCSKAIIYSADGVTWSRAPIFIPGVNAVAGSSFGFVAINGTDQAFFSSNGRNWSTNSLPISAGSYNGSQLLAQIVTYADGLFLVGGDITQFGGGRFFILASPDGINWPTNVNTGFAMLAYSYNFFIVGNGSNIIAGGVTGFSPFIQSSPDGLNWSMPTNFIPNPQPQGSTGAYGNGTYAMASSRAVWLSPDGNNWTIEPYTNPPTGPQSTFRGIAYSNGTNVVATSSSFVVSTNDALYAIASNTPSLNSVVSFGSKFVSVGTNGAVYQSANGVAWTPGISGTTNNLNGLAAGNSLLVAVGDNGTIQTSLNGTTWTSRTSGTASALYGVAYSNGLYVAVGQSGTIVTSPNGTTWTVQNSGVVSNLLAITYGPAGFLAVGTGGIILTSPDGISWTLQNSGSSATLETATAGNGYYVVAGASATVLTSYDGVNWASLNVGATGGQTFYGSGFFNGRFDIVGAYGNILESDPIPQFFNLQMHSMPNQNVFTFFATPGSTYRLVSSSNLVSGAWSTVTTFNNAAAITLWTNNVTGDGTTYFRLASP